MQFLHFLSINILVAELGHQKNPQMYSKRITRKAKFTQAVINLGSIHIMP